MLVQLGLEMIRVGMKTSDSPAQTKVFTRGRELEMIQVTIEEHQAEELGVQRLHYLYKLLKGHISLITQ